MKHVIIRTVSITCILMTGILITKVWSQSEHKRATPSRRKLNTARQSAASNASSTRSRNAASTTPAEFPQTYTVQLARGYPPVQRTEEETARFETVRTFLVRSKPVPEGRLVYFRWMDDPASPIQFSSWGCILQEVKPLSGGWLVKIQAMARANDSKGFPYDVHNRYLEEYEISETGEIRFIRGYPHPDDGDGTPKFFRFGGI